MTLLTTRSLLKEVPRAFSKGVASCRRHTKQCLHMSSTPKKTLSDTVIVLTGATSVGKSAVARLLCQELDAEIVIADSVQIYKHLDIGSNKPTVEEQNEIPHHLIDFCMPHEDFSSGDFVRQAKLAIDGILDRGKVPIVVGGSTMWVQWLVQGLPDAPKATAEIEQQAEELIGSHERANEWDEAVAVFMQYDSKRCEKLEKNNWYRLRRYLEVALSLRQSQQDVTGSDVESDGSDREPTLTGVRRSALDGKDVRCFFLSEDREKLYSCIDERCEEMLKCNLFEEVRDLITKRILKPDTQVAKSIGYRQAIKYLCREAYVPNDQGAFLDFVQEFATATRQYSKRQLKWYRQDENFLWLEIFRSQQVGNAFDLSQKNATNGVVNGACVHEGSEERSTVAETDKYAPYRRVKDEILHWLAKDRATFEKVKADQIKCGHSVSAYRDQKRKVPFPSCADVYQLAVTQALLKAGELKVPSSWTSTPDGASPSDQIEQVKGAGKRTASEEHPSGKFNMEEYSQSFDLTTIASRLEPKWSAEGVLIRGTEGMFGSKKMKTYTPNLKIFSKAESIEQREVVERADACHAALCATDGDIIGAFEEAFHGSVVPAPGSPDTRTVGGVQPSNAVKCT